MAPEFDWRAKALQEKAAALLATQHVVTEVERLCDRIGAKFMLVLSFSPGVLVSALRGEPNFDATFLEFLDDKPYPVVDMRDPFREMFNDFSGDLESFLKPYYIGHHTPLGNFATAIALKDSLVGLLEPKPLPYVYAKL